MKLGWCEGLNPGEMADHLIRFTKDDWLKIVDSLGEPLTDRISALLEPMNHGAWDGVDSTVGELIRLSGEISGRMVDAEKYRRVPEPMRDLFESEGQEIVTATLRLLESVNARIQVGMIEKLLRAMGPALECEGCALKETLESIENVLSHSYLDLAP
jgi:hypothetical protein